jgi:thermitase
MKFSKIFPLILAFVLALSLPAPILAAVPDGIDGATITAGNSANYILVKFQPGLTASQIAQIHTQVGGRFEKEIPDIKVQIVAVPTGGAVEKARAYVANPNVIFAEPDYVAKADGSPDDPSLANQWGLTKVQAPAAWEITQGSPEVKIAILDTGIELNHPDLAGKIVASKNFTSSNTADDVYGHGTHVAGIAAAATNNEVGVAGLGYNSTIMNVKVLGDDGYGSYSWIAQGIIWAADNGAQVINMSLGSTSASSTLESAVNYAWSKGVVVVASAGNSGSSTRTYPASYTNVIAVAATDLLDRLPNWSNFGDWVDVAAPGNSIYSTLMNNSYGYRTGTSMASPFVAGLAALVFTHVTDTNGNKMLNDEVRTQIEKTCDDIGVAGIGSGRINAYKAVQNGTTVTTGTVTGKVTDVDTGKAIASATVTDGIRSSSTDASGNYVIDKVPAGNCTIKASAVNYIESAQTVSVLTEQTINADFVLDENETPATTGTITGKVTDANTGNALPGATVTDGTRSAVTDSGGNYVINGVPGGNYTLTASAKNYTIKSQPVSVVAGQSVTASFALNQQPALTIQSLWVSSLKLGMTGKNLRLDVRVTGDNGAVAGAKVSATVIANDGKIWVFVGTTDSTGAVSFTVSKPSAGSYVARVTSVSAAGYTWDTTGGLSETSYTLTTTSKPGKPNK